MRYRLSIVLAEKKIRSITKFAELIGLNYETVRKVRDSEPGVKMETLEIIAKYLGVKVKDLLEEE